MKQQRKKQNGFSKLFIIFLVLIVLFIIILSSKPKPDNSTPQEEDLNARVGSNVLGLVIYNDDETKWIGCTVNLNSDYKIYADMDPGENIFSYGKFTKRDGTRFNYLTTSPKEASIRCENPSATSYVEW